MAHIVTDNCINCKYTDCVEVCPVDCFHEGPNFLVIDPDECIDCTLCIAECPARAIFHQDELPSGQQLYVRLNAELAKRWPVIVRKKPPLPDAQTWDGMPDKRAYLDCGDGRHPAEPGSATADCAGARSGPPPGQPRAAGTP